jgi:hypothetical protein
MAFVSTCTGTQDCPCGCMPVLGWDAMAEQVANNWDPTFVPPPPPPVLQRELFPPVEEEEQQIYSFYMPRNYSQNERVLAISLPNVQDETFVLVVPEGVGSGDQLFFTLPAERNGIIQKEMVTRIDHCQ